MIEKVLMAPCLFCDYNGAGFYQSGTHSEMCPWYRIGGLNEREQAVPAILQSAIAVAANARLLLLVEGYDGPCIGEDIQPLMTAVIEYDKARA